MKTAPSNPLVSVILPTFNRPDYLGESIESVLNQSLTDFELLIVDDASKVSGPREIAAQYAASAKGAAWARRLRLHARIYAIQYLKPGYWLCR